MPPTQVPFGLRLGSVWALSGLHLGSAQAPSGICLDSPWALAGLRLGSAGAPSGLRLGTILEILSETLFGEV